MNYKQYYKARQAQAREQARQWQQDTSAKALSWWELYQAQCYFVHLGKRWGLLREFHANGIC